uniref:BRMS1 like transcriptional repressor b n=1 Tax=Monopterus albus TaxID=43700 RepID=A0A3Q3KD75_MONAL
MPQHHDREKKDSTAEEMEVEEQEQEQEQEASSSEEEDLDTSSISEDGDSSEMDEEDCERRRMECVDEMSNLEKQFADLKDQLYRERLSQVNSKMVEVEASRAAEYLEPLAVLLENMQVRTKVAGIYRELCLETVKNKYQCETQAACQHWESEKLLLFDTVQSELEEKIQRLEEDRHSLDITSGNTHSSWSLFMHVQLNATHFSNSNKKVLSISTYYTYFIHQPLQSDWTAIRKVCASVASDMHSQGNTCVHRHLFNNQVMCLLFSRPWLRWVPTERRSILTAPCSRSDLTETDPFSTAEECTHIPKYTHQHARSKRTHGSESPL